MTFFEIPEISMGSSVPDLTQLLGFTLFLNMPSTWYLNQKLSMQFYLDRQGGDLAIVTSDPVGCLGHEWS